MIVIKSIEISGFMSYGEEPQRVAFADLGPTLITGENAGTADGSSNGSGKSSLAAAILWCLFGRTTTKERPGDAIVNWTLKKGCWVKIETADGYAIVRSRRSKGTPELAIVKGGVDITASTTTNAQAQLNALFNLDFEVFTSCVFFGQLGKSFLELPDARRRSILERVFNLHRINVWAAVAKEKVAGAELEQAKASAQAEQWERAVQEADAWLAQEAAAQERYEQARAAKVQELMTRKAALTADLAAMKLPDLADLKRRWGVVDQIRAKLDGYEGAKDRKAQLAFSLERDVRRIDAEEKAWHDKEGTACPTCKQGISGEHVAHVCAPFAAARAQAQDQVAALQRDVSALETLMGTIRGQVAQVGPQQTIAEAESIMREADRIKDQIVLMDTLAERARTEPSPHQQNIATWERKRLEAQNSFNNIKKRLDGFDIIIRHLTYIFSAYNDKQKLKSALLGDLVPFLNERVSYYLGALGCEFDLAFDATLKDTTTKWDYEFCSGGERKRIDLAVMFAFYDLYVAIYGPQCNVIVLDEVDGRLDPIGVEAFVSVIERDFTKKGAATGTHKPDAVLVISHKDEMRDAFPSKIKIVKDGGYSRIAEVRR